MNSLHRQEMGHFVHSLTPEQRTFLQRLLGESLAAFPRPGHAALHSGPEGVELMHAAVEPLFQLVDSLRCFEPAEGTGDIRPFSVKIPEPGYGVVTVHPRIMSWRGVWEAQSHSWVVDLHLGRLTVDVSQLHDLNSSTIAWLVTLAHQLPSHRIAIRGGNDTMLRSLRALRLDSTLVPEAEDGRAG